MDFIYKFKMALKQIHLIKYLRFVKSHFTWLSVLVIGLISVIIIFVAGYFNRYVRFDWWNWKQRALYKSIKTILFIIVLKIICSVL